LPASEQLAEAIGSPQHYVTSLGASIVSPASWGFDKCR
jgi:hypothetical protein